jgi:formate/nitrite transporter FocA (FNT family)
MIALMVWLLPLAGAARFWVIVAITYVVGLGALTHVVAGTIEVFALAAAGERSWPAVFFGYTVPALVGNSIGGVTLVAALNHAQVVAGRRSREAGKDGETFDEDAEAA